MKKEMFDNFIIALAPMAGVTDFAFRKICADFGADMVVTEMISAKAFEHDSKKTIKMLYEAEHKAIKCVQLFGHEVEPIENIVKSGALNQFDVIDLNCGCPAPKIVKNHEGSYLMQTIDVAEKILTVIRKSTDRPISVKFRLGINDKINYIEFGKMCEKCGVNFVTLHARTREQQYSGTVDKNAYKQLVEALNIPVLWSGDILTMQDVEFAKSIGCKGVMIARGALGSPEIFAHLKGITPPYSKKEAVKLHFNLMREYLKKEKVMFNYFKKHLDWYMKNLKNASELKRQAVSVKSIEETIAFIDNLPDEL